MWGRLTGFRKKSCLAFFLGLTLLGLASDANAEDILTVYRQAVLTSPLLARARASLQANEAFRTVSRSALFPRVQADAGGSLNHADITGFGQPIDEGYSADNYGVTLTQPLVRGQDWVALRASETQVRAGEQALAAAEQSLILRVSEAYFQVLRAVANERVARSKRDFLQKILEQAQKALKVGTGDIISVKEAAARLDTAESDLIGARNAVRIANRSLERLTHAPVGVLSDVGAIEPRGPVPDTVDPWVESALQNQPLLLEARQQLEISKDQIEIARRARWPRLDLSTGYNYSRGILLPGLKESESQVGLVLSLPLYQGGEIRARTRQAEALAMAEESRLKDLEDQVRLDVETNFLRLRDSVAQLKAAAQAVDSACISVEATRKGFEVGTRSFVDLFDGIQNLAVARGNYYLALYHHVLSRVQLKTAAGLVSIRDVEDINRRLGPAADHTGAGECPPSDTPNRQRTPVR